VYSYTEHYGPEGCVLFDDTVARLGTEAARAEEHTIQRLLTGLEFPEGQMGSPPVDQKGEGEGSVPQDGRHVPFIDPEAANDPQPPAVQQNDDAICRWTQRQTLLAVRLIRLVVVVIIFGLTVGLLKTRPPGGTDQALFRVILFTNVASCFLSIPGVNPVQIIIGILAMMFYFGEAIAFSVKMHGNYSCRDVDYIEFNSLIAGSESRCNMAKASIGFLWIGPNPPYYPFFISSF
jgi:hypothetical protein